MAESFTVSSTENCIYNRKELKNDTLGVEYCVVRKLGFQYYFSDNIVLVMILFRTVYFVDFSFSYVMLKITA